ncbi:MAG: hypothetical protein U9R06_03870 [Patescibacteria group bacterium]|nr:hypothetical protein [Patescibacteria group bacterium]
MTKFIIFLSILFLGIALSGCSTENTIEGDIQASEEAKLPGRQADIIGLVKSIVGNEIKIIKIDMAVSEELDDSTKDDQATSLTLSGTTGMRGSGMGSGGGGGIGDPADRIAKLKERSIGEVTVIAPVGIPIFDSIKNEDEDAEQKRLLEEASFSDISVEKMVNIWLDQNISDRKVAEYVSIFNF